MCLALPSLLDPTERRHDLVPVLHVQMNREKLAKMAGSVRTGGKGSVRRWVQPSDARAELGHPPFRCSQTPDIIQDSYSALQQTTIVIQGSISHHVSWPRRQRCMLDLGVALTAVDSRRCSWPPHPRFR